MRNNKWCLLLGIVSICAFATTTFARNVVERGTTAVDDGAVMGGVISSSGGASGGSGDIVYNSANISGYFFRTGPGFRDYDDIHIESGVNGELLSFSMAVFGSTVSGADAGSAFDVTVALYTDSAGDPAAGIPDALIPGTQCTFTGIPAGSLTVIQCDASLPGIAVPSGLWMGIEFSTDNSGWMIADFNDCPNTGPPGLSEDFFAEEDLIFGGFSFFFFGGCPGNPQASFGLADIVTAGQPWACCDLGASSCSNIQESDCAGVFTEGTLCNNLAQPCSEAGACCNTATGACSDTFASLCDGFLEAFTAGDICDNVTCDVPDNVPTVSQWGMIVLASLLVIGLTVKFGRRRTVTA